MREDSQDQRGPDTQTAPDAPPNRDAEGARRGAASVHCEPPAVSNGLLVSTPTARMWGMGPDYNAATACPAVQVGGQGGLQWMPSPFAAHATMEEGTLVLYNSR